MGYDISEFAGRDANRNSDTCSRMQLPLGKKKPAGCSRGRALSPRARVGDEVSMSALGRARQFIGFEGGTQYPILYECVRDARLIAPIRV
jgi:hypothetical protein